MTNAQRDFRLDIIRVFALFCVSGVHFFYNTSFYTTPLQGAEMIISVFIRDSFMICVPLFLILTGYLQGGKDIEPSKKYYLRLLKIIIPYSVITLIVWVFGVTLRLEPYINSNLITSLFGFERNGYSWYVAMYIGLYLLIPYLNKLYMSLETKRKRLGLIISLLVVIAVPSIMNNFIQLAPSYWMIPLYPILYYYAGSYIRDYPPKAGKLISTLISLSCIGITGAFTIAKNTFGETIKWGPIDEYYGLFVFVEAVAVFNFFLHINTSKTSKITRKIFATLSDSVFCAYLISVVTDLSIYYIFNTHIDDGYTEMFKRMPIFIFIGFVSCLILGLIINKITAGAYKGTNVIINRIEAKKANRDSA